MVMYDSREGNDEKETLAPSISENRSQLATSTMLLEFHNDLCVHKVLAGGIGQNISRN